MREGGHGFGITNGEVGCYFVEDYVGGGFVGVVFFCLVVIVAFVEVCVGWN